jgi:hypothetical protein
MAQTLALSHRHFIVELQFGNWAGLPAFNLKGQIRFVKKIYWDIRIGGIGPAI